MMGVYIKGIQMPKENQRGLWVVIHSDGTVEYDTGEYGWQTLRQSAFNVPPHGGLIDADAYIAYCGDKWIPLNIDAVNAQPTIIPAEETPGEDTNVPTYDLLYEEGGPDTR